MPLPVSPDWVSPKARLGIDDPSLFLGKIKPIPIGKSVRLDDLSLIISEKGNALKAEADDPTNDRVMELRPLDTPVAGDMGQQIAVTGDPISNIIGNIMGIFKGVFDAIGGIL